MDSGDSLDMRVPPLITLFRQAIKTFTPKLDGNFSSNFKNLKGILDTIRAEHVRLDPAFNSEYLWVPADKAPCSYIEVFENENFNMSIFILKPGFKMPLHDHPHMHGLLKVLSGSLKVRSFSEIQLTEERKTISQLNSREQEIELSSNGSKCDRSIFAEITEEKVCNEESECCILTPELSNYHEVEAQGVPTAFLDILAPPYATYIQNLEPRECRYYRVNEEISTNVVQLQEIPAPKWFYCDQAPYLGPPLT